MEAGLGGILETVGVLIVFVWVIAVVVPHRIPSVCMGAAVGVSS